MATREVLLPERYHAAVERWRDTYLADYGFLMDKWEKHFPKEPRFKLCAYRELGICTRIECGEDEGQEKRQRARDLKDDQAGHLLGAIRAQASTEFGSIQQHRHTLARAQSEDDQVWVLRMMAEELRHGYQMLHLLVDDPDWSAVAGVSTDEMVEQILDMRTGSHVLGAFNIDFDSFVDNIVFCALIDRVGKYQLSMQRVSAYQPMAESMPKMLREEAFHLATGVVPMRRWVTEAATGEVFVTLRMLQKAINKWYPRALEMFGDERGGGSNVRMGLKPMKNREAQEGYIREVGKLIDDLNMRYLRARLPELSLSEADALYRRLRDEGDVHQGIDAAELLRLPHGDFYRRRGVPAFVMTGAGGESFSELSAYLGHLAEHLPESYLASRDFKDFVALQKQVCEGELDAVAASRQTPHLTRLSGTCPCSKSVRWVRAPAATENGDHGAGSAAAAPD